MFATDSTARRQMFARFASFSHDVRIRDAVATIEPFVAQAPVPTEAAMRALCERINTARQLKLDDSMLEEVVRKLMTGQPASRLVAVV